MDSKEERCVKAIILAAGEGTRLQPFTETIPKPMLPIANKPMLSYIIDAISNIGISEIVIVVGYKKERIMDYFGEGKNKNISISYVNQEKQIGTGHALLQAKKYFSKEFLVIPADNIIDERLLSSIAETKAPALLCVRHQHPSKYGVVETKQNHITKIYEKPTTDKGNLISTGIYKCTDSIKDKVEESVKQGNTELTALINNMAELHEPFTLVSGKGLWNDVVYPWDLLHINERIMQTNTGEKAGTIEQGVRIKGPVSIGKNSILRSGSYIIGPVVIGDGCEIGPFSTISPSSVIGDNVTLGPYSEINNSILMNDVSIQSRCSLNHSVIGEGCSLGSHTIFEAGQAFVQIHDQGSFHQVSNTGSYIGNNTIIGSSVLIKPGTIIGGKTTINGQKTVTGRIKSQSMVA